jgi:tetratricopeptide (TPR) repeat protein
VSEALYERYKEALRRGHVSAIRGRLEQAAVAYGEAAAIAPERALPHVSLGSVLLQIGRAEDAVAAFSNALERAPRDETALEGRADALSGLGRPAEAADDYGVLAEVLDDAGRLAEALDAARRGIELAESKERRRHFASLAERIREGDQDDAARTALERAAPALDRGAALESGLPDEAPEEAPAEAISLDELAAQADAALDASDFPVARERLIQLARARAAARQPDAALDACGLALTIAPDDPDVHLALVDLYLERGWRSAAVDKLALLGRLAELTGDDPTRERLRALVAEKLPDEPRLAQLTA